MCILLCLAESTTPGNYPYILCICYPKPIHILPCTLGTVYDQQNCMSNILMCIFNWSNIVHFTIYNYICRSDIGLSQYCYRIGNSMGSSYTSAILMCILASIQYIQFSQYNWYSQFHMGNMINFECNTHSHILHISMGPIYYILYILAYISSAIYQSIYIHTMALYILHIYRIRNRIVGTLRMKPMLYLYGSIGSCMLNIFSSYSLSRYCSLLSSESQCHLGQGRINHRRYSSMGH